MNSAPATAVNVFVTNALPYFCDHTDGLWRRFRVIKFSEVMAGRNTENTNLRDELERELPGIYNWALHGAAMLDPGKPFPGTEEGQHILTEHRENCNPLLPLIRKLFKEEEGKAISRKDAYRRFRDSADALMRNPPTKQQFTVALRKEFPKVQSTVM